MNPPLGRGLDALLGPNKTKNNNTAPQASPLGGSAPMAVPEVPSTAIPVTPVQPAAPAYTPIQPQMTAPIASPMGAPAAAPVYMEEAPASHGMEEGQLIIVPLSKIKLNPFQPRREFDPEALAQLASSIRQHGLIQPIVVIQEGDNYILVAGERRFRACQMLGLADVPAILKEADQNQRVVLSLVENLQRRDLNSIEKAEAYKKLHEMLGLSHIEISEKLGISKSAFSNTIRFLKLPAKAREALKDGSVSEGQMLVIMSAGDEPKVLQLLDQFLNHEKSMNEIKNEIARYRLTTTHGLMHRKAVSLQPEDVVNVRTIEERLGVRGDVKRARNGGVTISLTCHDENQYRELADKLKNLSW